MRECKKEKESRKANEEEGGVREKKEERPNAK